MWFSVVFQYKCRKCNNHIRVAGIPNHLKSLPFLCLGNIKHSTNYFEIYSYLLATIVILLCYTEVLSMFLLEYTVEIGVCYLLIHSRWMGRRHCWASGGNSNSLLFFICLPSDELGMYRHVWTSVKPESILPFSLIEGPAMLLGILLPRKSTVLANLCSS